MAYKIFSHIPDESACCLYRNKLPYLHCYSELSRHGIKLVGKEKADDDEYDCYIFNRLVRPNFYQGFISQIRNKKLVLQTDDDIWHIPTWNPVVSLLNQEDLDSTALYINEAAQIITSTEYLADLINLPHKTTVLPNLIDIVHFNDLSRKDGPLKILWCGSASHHGDLQEIVEPIIKIVEKYKDVAVIFWGYFPTDFANFQRVPGYPFAELVPKYPNIYKGEWFDISLYFNKLTELQPDIAIIPLQDCLFNYSKSSLKFLELSMAGAACIASNLPPYECIKHMETGVLANTQDDWYNALVELIENKALRLKIADNAKEQVIQEYSWQCSKRLLWQDFFLKLAT